MSLTFYHFGGGNVIEGRPATTRDGSCLDVSYVLYFAVSLDWSYGIDYTLSLPYLLI